MRLDRLLNRLGPSVPRVRTWRVGEAEIRFCGYSDRRVKALLERFDVRLDQDPPLLELDQVLFHPGLRCLYDLDGRRIEPSKVIYVEPDAPAPPNAKMDQVEQDTMPAFLEVPPGPARVAETVLFLGEAHDHFGHLLTDTLGRMWALDRVPPDIKVLFAPDPKQRLDPPLVRFLLDRLGLDDGRILRPQGPTLFERVLCPVAALQLGRIYGAFARPHRRIAGQALAGLGAEAPDAPVYLSRRGLEAGQRRPAGEEELEARLEREGFRIVQPERLDLVRQMALFNGDHPVVGAYGSALHGVLFRLRPEGQRLGALFPMGFASPPRFAMIDAVVGSRGAYINCLREAGRGASGEDWRIDVGAAMAELDGAGFFARDGG